MSNWSLLEATDKFLCRPRISLPKHKTFYPSEASAQDTDGNVFGHCNRASWYRLQDYSSKISEPSKPSSHWAAEMGSKVEEIQWERWKQMGILLERSLKFVDAARNISGEFDGIIAEPDGKPTVVENKSFWGYYATKEICGDTRNTGKPKDQNLMQVMIYIDQATKANITDRAKLVYNARDSSQKAEFDVRLETIDGQQWPIVKVAGTTKETYNRAFSLEMIYNRFAELKQFVDTGVEPPRDFQKEYSAEKIELLFAKDELSKAKYDAWKKGKETPGSWQCSYCNFASYCYRKQ